MAEKGGKNKINLLGTGALAAFLSLAVIVVYLGVTLFLKSRQEVSDSMVVGNTSDDVQEEVEVPWRTYSNTEFEYEISHPGLLFQREFVDQGGYIHFVRFEETAFSVDKGVAVGISRNNLEEELGKTRAYFEGEAELVDEKQITIDGHEATYFVFNPLIENAEGRAIVVFERGGFVYSISTVPEQIDKVVESFGFLS